MKLFAPLYDRVMAWSGHRYAPRYLAALSFAESSFFPIPPDVMLIPMTTTAPSKGVRFAFITTIASVIGGIFGYLIGLLAFDALAPWLQQTTYWPKFLLAQEWFHEWGVWVVFVAGFSPIPYKLFTIAAGALSLAMVPFVIASFIGRGARFFLVALLLVWVGPRLEPSIRKYIETIGWMTVGVLVVAIVWYQLTK
jgi:membrane protein YqaA with SNARE-associated domain